MRLGLGVHLVVVVAVGLPAGCSPSSGPPSSTRGCPAFDALVVGSDYSSSAVGTIAKDGTGSLATGVDLGADPVLTTSRGRAFLVARDRSEIFELDPTCGTPIGRFNAKDPAHSGTSNPQDVAVAPDGSLFVARFNVPTVLVLDRAGAPRGTIDLASFDGDGNPNASSIRIVDVAGVAKAFVTLERLDDHDMLKSKQASWMLRVDVATMAVEASIPLVGRNPFNLMTEHEGALYLAEPGNFDAADEALAGVERFDPSTGATRLLVGERDLGGSVAEVVVTAGCGVAIVADATAKNRTSLVAFDPGSGGVLAPASAPILGPTEDYDLEGLAWKGDVLFVGDRRRTPRGYAVHVFDRAGACGLRLRPDAVFFPQKPVALRVIP